MMASYIKNFPHFFSLLFEDFLIKIENDLNKDYHEINLMKTLVEFIFIEKFNLFSTLFDNNDYSLRNLLNKVEHLKKVNFILTLNFPILILGFEH